MPFQISLRRTQRHDLPTSEINNASGTFPKMHPNPPVQISKMHIRTKRPNHPFQLPRLPSMPPPS
ncbi:hypothetical protein BJ508DRAFT_416340 [Ascobolus immersus RN42]|uniref:Uncharacterized protein n=1 Tax=Ascobolus immersus RN42 TaxID=1160509 RepID=A0A3N4I3W8_ASCIM|nr:hypothetical protein BJ508DRAFT_416340 [Ascobolus immersus RN42]